MAIKLDNKGFMQFHVAVMPIIFLMSRLSFFFRARLFFSPTTQQKWSTLTKRYPPTLYKMVVLQTPSTPLSIHGLILTE